MKRALVIIGGSKHHVRFITAAKHKGYINFVFDKNSLAPAKFNSDYFFAISTDNYQAIIKELNLYKNIFLFKGVLSYSSRFLALNTVLELAKVFRFNSFSAKCHNYLFDKELLFSKLSLELNIPKFMILNQERDIDNLHKTLGFPLIIKPTRGMGSKNVFKIVDKRQLDKFCNKIKKGIKKNKIIIQKYVQGNEYCLNGFVFRGEVKLFPIVQKFTLDPNHCFTHLGFKVLKKGDLSNSLIRGLKDTFARTCQLLQADNYFFASDVIISGTKIYIIDFGFLLDSKIDRLLFATGLDIYDILIDITASKKPNYGETLLLEDNIYLKFLFANKKGRLKINSGIKVPTQLDALEWERTTGDIVVPPSSIADALGWIVAKELDFNNKSMERNLFSVL